MQTDVSDLPLFRLRRSSDPDTALLAAIKAAKASPAAVKAVRAVMVDGAPRIDEEIWRACRRNDYISSFATVRHGRLALSEAGVLRETGERRNTSDGMPSRVWIAA